MKNTDISINKMLLEKYKDNEIRVKNWITTVFKNYYKRFSLDFNQNYINDNDKIKYIKDQEIYDELNHIIDYLTSNESPKRIERLSYPDAKRLANKWVYSLNKKASLIEREHDVLKVKELSNGCSIVQLITKQAFEREGKYMNHCVASHYQHGATLYSNHKLRRLYSLRDNNNIPHCTVELNLYSKFFGEKKVKITELQGKSNKKVKIKYRTLAFEMVEYLIEKYDMNISELEEFKQKISIQDKLECYTEKNILINKSKPKRRYLLLENLKEEKEETLTENFIIEYRNIKELEFKLSQYENLHINESIEVHDKEELFNISQGLVFNKDVDITIKNEINISDNVIFKGHVVLNSQNVNIGKNVIFEEGVTIKSRNLYISENVKIDDTFNADINNIIGFKNCNIVNLTSLTIKGCVNLPDYPTCKINLEELYLTKTEIKNFPLNDFPSNRIYLEENIYLRELNNINANLVYLESNDIEKIDDLTVVNLRCKDSKVYLNNISANSNICNITTNKEKLLIDLDIEIKNTTLEENLIDENEPLLKEIEQRIYDNYNCMQEEIFNNIKLYKENPEKYMENSLKINYNKLAIVSPNVNDSILIRNNDYTLKNEFNYNDIRIKIRE